MKTRHVHSHIHTSNVQSLSWVRRHLNSICFATTSPSTLKQCLLGVQICECLLLYIDAVLLRFTWFVWCSRYFKVHSAMLTFDNNDWVIRKVPFVLVFFSPRDNTFAFSIILPASGERAQKWSNKNHLCLVLTSHSNKMFACNWHKSLVTDTSISVDSSVSCWM